MANYNSTHTGAQIDDAITLVETSTDTTTTDASNVPSSTNKIATINKVGSLVETGKTYTTCTLPVFTAAGSQNVLVTGVTSTSHPVLDVLIDDADDINTCNIAWSHIYKANSYDGGITFYSDAVTDTALTIAVKGY